MRSRQLQWNITPVYVFSHTLKYNPGSNWCRHSLCSRRHVWSGRPAIEAGNYTYRYHIIHTATSSQINRCPRLMHVRVYERHSSAAQSNQADGCYGTGCRSDGAISNTEMNTTTLCSQRCTRACAHTAAPDATPSSASVFLGRQSPTVSESPQQAAQLTDTDRNRLPREVRRFWTSSVRLAEERSGRRCQATRAQRGQPRPVDSP